MQWLQKFSAQAKITLPNLKVNAGSKDRYKAVQTFNVLLINKDVEYHGIISFNYILGSQLPHCETNTLILHTNISREYKTQKKHSKLHLSFAPTLFTYHI